MPPVGLQTFKWKLMLSLSSASGPMGSMTIGEFYARGWALVFRTLVFLVAFFNGLWPVSELQEQE